MSPRTGGRPSRDRVMVSFYLSRTDKQAVETLAEANGLTQADTYRTLLKLGLQQAQAKPKLFRDSVTS